MYLLKNSFLKNGKDEVRVDKRIIAAGYGKESKEERINNQNASEVLKRLMEKEGFKVGDTNRDGTQYSISLAKVIP